MSSRVHGPTTTHALDVVEAGYSLTGSDTEWLTGVLDAAKHDLEDDGGSYAFTTHLGDPSLHEPGTGIDIGPAYAERALNPELARRVAELNRTVPPEFFQVLARTAVLCGGFLEMAPEELLSHMRATVPSGALTDSFSLFVQDGEGWALNVSVPTSARVHAAPRVRGVWKRVGLHLASGMRLRRRLRSAGAVREGIFTPSGALSHAEGEVRAQRSARDALVAAVRSIERARTTRGRADPERAFELWTGLVAGEWSLVDQWEKGGRRYLAAYRNRPNLRDPRGLTRVESLVLRYVSLAASSKEVAFTLGISANAVDSAVSRLLRKLRCRRRSDLLAFADLSKAARLELELGGDGDTVDVLSLPHTPAKDLLARLSAAERSIAKDIVRGKTNAEIARARKTSTNTVANQLRSIFEKLGVGSRLELAAKMTGGRPGRGGRTTAQ